MPPATRREVRLSASLPDPSPHSATSQTVDSNRSTTLFMPNMESILDNFEQFKRKHICQNREIIKANAVAQLRIRELENRIQSLEADKVQKQIDTLALTNQVSHLRHAIGCIHTGWEAIGRGLTLGAADAATSHMSVSNRVAVEPIPNAAVIVRAIAKPPEGHLRSLQEETSETHPTSDATTTLAPASEPYYDDWQQHFQALRDAQSAHALQSHPHMSSNPNTISSFDIDGAPSPMGSPELPMELEDAIAAATSRSASQQWSLPDIAAPPPSTSSQFKSSADLPDLHHLDHTLSRQSLRRSGRKSSRRQSGLIPQNGYPEPHSASQSPEPESAYSTPAPSSDSYMPSEANSETTDGLSLNRNADQRPAVPSNSYHHPPAPLVDITNAGFAPSSSLYHPPRSCFGDNVPPVDATPRKARRASTDANLASQPAYTNISATSLASEARTPGGRKRKVPAHEPQEAMPTPARLFSAAIEATTSTPAAPAASVRDAEAEPHTGRTRRVRKSINYALPKLNTKMRKPDPSDLVPAPTPHRSNGATPSSARSMVGSSGNLSDIRKLHEAAALRQSPAERASNMRSKRSPGQTNGDMSADDDDGGVRMADLFEIRHHAKNQPESRPSSTPIPNTPHSFWGVDALADTSDDDSRVTSNADLGELAELEAAMTDLCTADEGFQVDTPRAPQPSTWPSQSEAGVSASSSTDSMVSCSSSAASNATSTKRPSLRRKTTTLPSRSRQSSVEQPLQTDSASGTATRLDNDNEGAGPNAVQIPGAKTAPLSSTKLQSSAASESAKASAEAQSTADTRKVVERVRSASSTPAPTELGNGRPPMTSSGLAAGMKPKQRPASAGAALMGSRSASGCSSTGAGVERPRTFSATTAANAGVSQSGFSTGSAAAGMGRSASATSSQRASLHSALTNQTKATPGQITPRIGAKGPPTSTTPSSKESPRFVGTPTLRPTLSTSSLASESSGRASPALSAASTSSTGTQLSTSTRSSLKTNNASTASQPAKIHRPGTSGSTASTSASSREGSTLRLNGSSSSTSLSGTRPQPTRSMPSLRRATEKTAVTSTPRITVRSSSSTLPSAAVAANGAFATTPAASIAASKVARAISSAAASRTKEAGLTPMGLGIDFSPLLNEGSAGKELIDLTDKLQQALQSSSSTGEASNSSEADSSPPTSTSKSSSEDVSTSGASLAKARRTSRRISGLTA